MIVLDASVLIAHWNPRDKHHDRATALMDNVKLGRWGRPLLPEYVLVEVVTVLGRRLGHAMAADIGRLLLQQREIQMVRCVRFLPQAMRLLRMQSTLRIGLVDATIVAIANSLEDPNVATFDHGISEREDIRALPPPSGA